MFTLWTNSTQYLYCEFYDTHSFKGQKNVNLFDYSSVFDTKLPEGDSK